VRVGGERIYSKHETGRFPDEEDILDALAEEGAVER
jgi:hypothetical protein